jgi:Helix-turn-helix domain
MVKSKSQLQRIIDILEEGGQIDNFWAIDTRLTTRLAMHVNLLRNRGYEIDTEELPNKNCIYRLIAAPKPQQLSIA